MNIINDEQEKENTINLVCEFLNYKKPNTSSLTLEEAIRVICVARLCQAIGITCKYNYKSSFFEFFSSIMGEALCEKLSIKIHIAGDELRLVRYDNVNLVSVLKYYLDNESVEEAFLDAFNFVDQYKYLIPTIKQLSY